MPSDNNTSRSNNGDNKNTLSCSIESLRRASYAPKLWKSSAVRRSFRLTGEGQQVHIRPAAIQSQIGAQNTCWSRSNLTLIRLRVGRFWRQIQIKNLASKTYLRRAFCQRIQPHKEAICTQRNRIAFSYLLYW